MPPDLSEISLENLAIINFNVDQALKNYKLVFSNEESAIRSEILAIEKLIEANEHKKAIVDLAKLIQKFPNSARCLYLSARLLEWSADREKSNIKLKNSIDVYKKVFKLSTPNKEISFDINLHYLSGVRLIQRLKEMGNINNSIKYAIAMLETFPDNLYVMNELGIDYMLVYKYKLAKTQFQRVLHLNASHAVAMCHLAFILKQTEVKPSEKILEMFKNCLQSNEHGVKDPRFFYQAGDALQRRGRTDEVKKILILFFNFKSFTSLFNIGLCNLPNWCRERIVHVTVSAFIIQRTRSGV